ncbi:hypothetical protein J2W97_002409 [Paenibacillus jamilae]|nr:hypothetical protein [Paenibacillus jamilae]
MSDQEDAATYCPYYKPDSSCVLLQAMSKADKRCKAWRGDDSVRCRYLSTQVARRS